MACITEAAIGFPNASGTIPPENGMLPEILGEVGWNTYMTGKWHLCPTDEMHLASTRRNWPGGRGFERYYGFLGAETDQWHPDLVYDNHPVEPPRQPEDGYHLTEDLTDKALEFIKDAKAVAPDKPFFLYYAPGACHAPHQAPREWIDRYKGRFDAAMRRCASRRWPVRSSWASSRDTELPPINPIGTPETRTGPDGKPFPAVDTTRPWESLSADERRLFARMAEVYAGFLSHVDNQIGRLLDYLKETDQLENTLIVLVSDNGASGEGGPNGSVNENKFFNGVPDDIEANLALLDDLGGPKTYNHYPNGWAMAFNTPFKMWKRYEFNGGTCDPCIISWPKSITARGEVRHQYHHAIDIVPTVLDCLGVEAPGTIKGHVQSDFDGISMRYSFNDADAPTRRKTQFYSMLGSRAIWHEGWKAVSTHPTISGWSHFNDDTWELYHVESDPSELHDLAAEHPEKVRELVNLWFAEAGANGAFPLDDRSAIEILNTPRPQLTSPRDRYLYYPDTAGVPEAQAVNIRNRNYVIGAVVDVPAGGAEGVLFAQGSHFGGHALFVKDGRLHYVYNFVGMTEQRVVAERGRPHRRGPAPVGLVRKGRRGSARCLHRDRDPVPRRPEGGRGADQDPALGVRPLGHRPHGGPGDQQHHRHFPGRAAVAVLRGHDPRRRDRRQRRALRRSRACCRRHDRPRVAGGRQHPATAFRPGPLGRGLAEQPFDEHAVLPLAVETPVALLHADLPEPGGEVCGAAGAVVGEDAAGQLVEAASLGLLAQRAEEPAAEALAPAVRVDVHGVLAHALIHAAVRVEPGAGPSQDPALALDDQEGPAVVQPAGNVRGRAQPRLQCGDALADPGVVGRDDGVEVGVRGGADRDGGRERQRRLTLFIGRRLALRPCVAIRVLGAPVLGEGIALVAELLDGVGQVDGGDVVIAALDAQAVGGEQDLGVVAAGGRLEAVGGKLDEQPQRVGEVDGVHEPAVLDAAVADAALIQPLDRLRERRL